MNSTSFDLQSETSSEKRRELMRKVADLFIVGAGQFEDGEAVLLEETFTELLFRLPAPEQTEISEEVADSEFLPNSVAAKLANSDEHIATPVIERSPALTTDDLVNIANNKGQGHLKALSKRRHIAEEVTNVIVDRGNNDVLGTLAHNNTAQISDPSFSKMVDRAVDSDALKAGLAQRADIPNEAIEKLVPMLSEEASLRLASLLEANGREVGEIFQTASSQVQETRLKVRAQRLSAKAILKEIQNGTRSIDDAIALLCKEDRLLDILMILTNIAGISEAQGLNAFKQKSAEPLAVLSRAANVSETTVRHLDELRRTRMGRTAEKILPSWQRMSSDDSNRILRFTKISGTVRGS